MVFRWDDWTWDRLARNGRPSKPGLERMLEESGDEDLMRWRQAVGAMVEDIRRNQVVAWSAEDERRFWEALDQWILEICQRKGTEGGGAVALR